MSQLVEFYRGSGTDNRGRTLSQIWNYNDGEMELCHDFIQWMFPVREASQFNRHAPLMGDSDIAAFRAEAELRANLSRSLDRFLAFLGLEWRTGEIAPGPAYRVRSEILKTPNHNWLRITRVLHCLRLLGLEAEGRRLLDCLEKLQADGRAEIAPETLRYWRDATDPGRVD